MEKLKPYWEKYNHGLTFLYLIVLCIIFKYLEVTVVAKYFMYSPIDDYIPFLKIFVVPYVIWYAYMGVALGYFFFNSKEDFFKLSAFLYIGMAFSLFIYYILPNGQNLRPVLEGNDIFTNIIRTLYLADTPTNSAPSLHVIDSIAIHVSIIHYNGWKNRKLICTSSFILMILICASTVFIKQHSIIDVFWGLVVSAVLYIGIYKVNWKKLKRKA